MSADTASSTSGIRDPVEEAGYGLLDAAHQRLGGPLVLVWNSLNAHVSRAMGERSRPGTG
jgi:hypothetical protein